MMMYVAALIGPFLLGSPVIGRREPQAGLIYVIG